MSESRLQTEISKALSVHPKVAWIMTITSGAAKMKGFYVSLGKYRHKGELKTGVSDLIGQLTDGRIFVIEVKLPNKKPTQEQIDFTTIVKKNGGISGVAHSLDEAIKLLVQ